MFSWCLCMYVVQVQRSVSSFQQAFVNIINSCKFLKNDFQCDFIWILSHWCCFPYLGFKVPGRENNISGTKSWQQQIVFVTLIIFTGSRYSRTSMARTSLGPWKFVRDMGSSSHWGLIMAQVQEANSDNLGKSFRFSTQWLYVECTH